MEISRGYEFFVGCSVINVTGEDFHVVCVNMGVARACTLEATVA